MCVCLSLFLLKHETSNFNVVVLIQLFAFFTVHSVPNTLLKSYFSSYGISISSLVGFMTGKCVNQTKTCEIYSWCPNEDDSLIPEYGFLFYYRWITIELASQRLFIVPLTRHFPLFCSLDLLYWRQPKTSHCSSKTPSLFASFK